MMKEIQVVYNGLWPTPVVLDIASIPKGFTVEKWIEHNRRTGISVMRTDSYNYPLTPTESYRFTWLDFGDPNTQI